MGISLRSRVQRGQPPLLLPGAPNALTARLIEDLGFEALYVSGAGVANTFLGAPDIGLVSLSELTQHVAAIRDAVDIPIVVDADTGFGNALNMRRTVHELVRAGANALQIEDQITPKRCGHFEGKDIISAGEMVGKIHAATDARGDSEVLIIARTDALGVVGLDQACERASLYLAEGADVAFVEAPVSREQLEEIPKRVDGPVVANIVEGGKTPQLPLADLEAFGYSMVLYANAAMRAGISGMTKVLQSLKTQGDTLSVLDDLASWNLRQDLVRKPSFDALDAKYAAENFTTPPNFRRQS
ncbi:oxaloacetate decarboxylase [Tessaracoccus sp. OS52]|uniref:isocitrate lyase/PEP mutase family protein n=1 Tax=Tessaracoccus sp. OS52 TaxID=2886691 RepID=UPI001D108532|nr:oxaloacetate decarboxylase [Tessaracoccus sp. OS52]MCC2593949.1 oxaloacetate decarboxylase [Tessaracoccus sp. OS52]